MAADYGYAQLEAWLQEHHARCVGQGEVGRQHHDLYIVNGRLLIVALQRDPHGQIQGWEIYIPASAETRIDAALTAAEIACDLPSHKG
jgi:hypothetical protein